MDEKIVKDSQGLVNDLVNDTVSRQAAVDAINSLINRFEQILRDIRETNVDNSVCGMCEYDGAYIGQSGDWCNECPGFEKDDCFKLSEACRKRWLESVELPHAQPETHDKRTETHACDLISRQEAIDAVKKNTFRLTFAEEQNCEGHLAWSANAVYSDVIEGALLELPSAQPETTERTTETAQNVSDRDLISRKAAIDAIRASTSKYTGFMEMEMYTDDDAVEAIEALPSAQPERKRGKWIAVTEDGDVYKRICSCCGREAFFQNDDPDELYDGGRYELSDFCPHCGADMREVDE